jgi:hypothetical protein
MTKDVCDAIHLPTLMLLMLGARTMATAHPPSTETILKEGLHFQGNRHKLWDGRGRYSKLLPFYNLRVTGKFCNHFDDIKYAVRLSNEPPECQRACCLNGIFGCWLTTLLPTSTSPKRGRLSPASILRLTIQLSDSMAPGAPRLMQASRCTLPLSANDGGKIQNLANIMLGILL